MSITYTPEQSAQIERNRQEMAQQSLDRLNATAVKIQGLMFDKPEQGGKGVLIAFALAEFVNTWGDSWLSADVGPRLNCGEVEALADLFDTLGLTDEGTAWRVGHAEDDDGGDMHNPDGSVRELDENGDYITEEDDDEDERWNHA